MPGGVFSFADGYYFGAADAIEDQQGTFVLTFSASGYPSTTWSAPTPGAAGGLPAPAGSRPPAPGAAAGRGNPGPSRQEGPSPAAEG